MAVSYFFLFHDQVVRKQDVYIVKQKREDIDIQQTRLLTYPFIHKRTKEREREEYSFVVCIHLFDLLVANIKCCYVECLLYVAFTNVDCLVKKRKKKQRKEKNVTNKSSSRRRGRRTIQLQQVFIVCHLYLSTIDAKYNVNNLYKHNNR